MADEQIVQLKDLHPKKKSFKAFLHEKMPFLFDVRSLFYFGIGLFILGFLWMGYSLLNNSFTQLYGWDYQSQYVTMAYGFHDTWQKFFRTGYFELYSTNTYLGVDQIGANAYYGLFDPFLLLAYIVTPRSWIPQMYALLTIVKGMVGGLGMRWYCRYLGMKESSARVAGTAYAFNGFINFMVGFPTMVSASALIPFCLLGIEKVLKDKKPYVLAVSLLLLGMSCFFYLVVFCLFGVFYSIIRYFMTLKSRDLKDNLSVIGIGVYAFAAGLLLGSWVLFPSLRESSLSGRTTSLGSLYLEQITTSIKTFDIGGLFAAMFQMVGRHPVREMQGITSFLFPTVNYLWLPLARPNNYDSWTASMFSYTPIVILFFIALVSAVRRKKVGELLLFALFSYLVFTNFAYYFFYAFAGDGYGRWYIVLVPLIVYYGSRELDRLKEEPKWVIVTGALFTLTLSVVVWALYAFYFNGMTFDGTGMDGYWPESYTFPAYGTRDGIMHSLSWMIYYQFGLYGLVSVLFICFRYKKWLPKVLMGIIAVETIVCGNCSFIYGSSWSYQHNYNGGASFAEAMTSRIAKMNEDGEGTYYRTNIEGLVDKNSQIAFGANGTSHFSSLFNYETAALNAYSRLSNGGWSAYYGNKRVGLDLAFGTKYYVVRGEGYGSGFDFAAPNVPFDSECVYSDASYQIFRSGLNDDLYFSWMVNGLYPENNRNVDGSGLNIYQSDWYTGGTGDAAAKQVMRNEEVYVTGGIVQDEDLERLEALGAEIGTAPSYSDTAYSSTRYYFSSTMTGTLTADLYTTSDDYTYYGIRDGVAYGPAAFLDPDTSSDFVLSKTTYDPGASVRSDFQKIVLSRRIGTYLNEDWDGAYFALYIPNTVGNVRVYMIGDTMNADGTINEYQLLSYEYATLRDWNSGLRVNSSMPLFGMYAPGRVRAIVFLGKPSERQTYSLPSSFNCYMLERESLEGILDSLQAGRLKNVVYTSDRFEADGTFERAGMMTSVLAYDAGWKVTLQGEDGTSIQAETFNLNGGFLGYYVPAGNYHVVFSYETPFLNVASVFYTVSFLSLVGFFLIDVGVSYKKALAKEGMKIKIGRRRA